WHRPTFWWSPAISRSLDAGLQVSGLTKEDVDLYDLYSCFPIVPKLACQHLNLPINTTTSAANDPSRNKPLTLLGGLTSFGGAGNNYSLHAITEMTRQLRRSNTSSSRAEKVKRTTGLILANGGWVTYQHVVCLSNSPRVLGGGGKKAEGGGGEGGDGRRGAVYPPEAPLPEVVDDVQVPRVREEVVEDEEGEGEGEATVE
ncbi:hypothetical protein KC347_g9273, partial [Hortaea werneckii]